MIIHEYINQLVNYSTSELKNNYYTDDFGFDQFDIINFFLIDKILNQDEYSLSIVLPQRDVKRDFYIPALLSVAATLFVKNYVNDKTDYSIGEIVQKDGLRFKIKFKDDLGYMIQSVDNEKTKYILTNKQIRKYIVTTADLTPRQVKTKFNHYKNLFNLIFQVDYVPSKFTHKTVMILEKSEFLKSLEIERDLDVDLKKAIPFQWVTKRGLTKHESDFIPIEPMIYLVPDYETFKEHLIDKIENLDSVIFIGKNKYEPFITEINYDLRRNNIPKAIFIGSNEIDTVDSNVKLKTWKWTLPEFHHFNEVSGSTFELVNVESKDFLQAIERFEEKIIEIDNNYFLNIKELLRLKKILYSTALPSKSLRLAKQLEYIKYVYEKEIKSIVTESFLGINENPERLIEELVFLANEIIKNITIDKFKHLIQNDKIDVLIVPELFIDTWKEDLYNCEFSDIFSKTKLLSFKEFQENNIRFTTRKNVYILSIFGFKDTPIEILQVFLQSPNNYFFILYPEENKLIEKLLNKCDNDLTNQLNSKDRYALSTIEYPKYQKDEDISDIISRFYEKDGFEKKSYNYEPSENIEYEITFDNGDKVILEGSKTILLLQENKTQKQRKEKVFNIISGDRIRVYENTSKDRLFELALEKDSKRELHDIIDNSKIWKECLKNYYITHDSILYEIEKLLSELYQQGAKIKIPTLRKWLNSADDVFFPSQVSNLIAIKKTINCDILNEKFNDILRSRKAFRSIMISLGRDLSDELLDYIISNGEKIGKMLEKFSKDQIDEFINESAPLRKVNRLRIIDTEEDE